MAAIDKVEEHISDAVAKGATLAAGGSRHELGGQFFQPTVLTNVTDEMKIFHEETFGPVAPLFRFKTEDEAIEMANNTPFGLAAYAYTTSLARAQRAMDEIEAGMIGINRGLVSDVSAPFGGVKASGLGREGGEAGMDEYQETVYVAL